MGQRSTYYSPAIMSPAALLAIILTFKVLVIIVGLTFKERLIDKSCFPQFIGNLNRDDPSAKKSLSREMFMFTCWYIT